MKVAVSTLAVLSALILGARWYLSQPYSKEISPWPEYEPVSQILISSHLFEFGNLASEIIEAADKVKVKVAVLEDLNPITENWTEVKAKLENVEFLPMPHSGVWLRDFAPVNVDITQRSNGLSSLGFADFNYKLEPSLDDILPWQLALYFKTSLIKTPFTLDGGNFVATRDDCFLADDFIEVEMKKDLTSKANPSEQTAQVEKDLESERQRIASMIAKEFQCRAHIISNSPHPHIDMVLKPLSSEQILVSEIPEYLISHLKDTGAPNLEEALAVKKKLDEIAKKLTEDLHFKVLRLPMPAPSGRMFRNYVNSIVLDKTIFMPSYQKSEHSLEPYWDLPLLEKLEQEARRTYESLGFHVVSLNSDRIIAAGGSLHCVALTIPK